MLVKILCSVIVCLFVIIWCGAEAWISCERYARRLCEVISHSEIRSYSCRLCEVTAHSEIKFKPQAVLRTRTYS
jgi:hypothetical protein